MDKETLITMILIAVFGFSSFMFGYSLNKDKNCTITITDMRGVQHVIKGVADE